MRNALALVLIGASLFACTKSTDPSTADYWLDRLADKRQRNEALKELGKIGDKKAVPVVTEWFDKEGDWQPDAAYTLGLLGDKSVVPKLIAGLDFQVGTGQDRTTRNKNRTNINIVRALAMLRADTAVDRMIRLLDSPEATVREATIRSLGKLGNPAAIDPLMEIARNDREPFLRKTAIQALGDIGDPKAVPTLIEMMYVEMPNVSFYYEARYALLQIGEAAGPALTKTLKRENKAVEDIRLGEGRKIGEGAVEAKAASVLGYLGIRDAEGLMIETMQKLYRRYQQRESRPVFASVPGAIGEICYALGNLATPTATKAILPIALDPDERIRVPATEALTQIGDRSVVGDLLKAARKGEATSRRAVLIAVSRLGQADDLAAFDKLAEAGDKKVPKKVMAKLVEQERVRLVAAGQCQQDLACWRGKLSDPDSRARDKAAWELGWLGAKEAVPDLMKAVEDDDAVVRMAAILSLSRVGGADPDQLEKIHDRWAKKLDYAGVNQELKRLIARLRSHQPKK